MESFLIWSKETRTCFPDLLICTGIIQNVKVERHTEETETEKQSIIAKMRQKHKIELLKDDPTVRAYRDLYWSLGIDPTKTRPSEKLCFDGCCTETISQAYRMSLTHTTPPH